MPPAKKSKPGVVRKSMLPVPAEQEGGLVRDRSAFAATVKGLKAKYPGHVFMGDEYAMPWLYRRLPTGITELDIAINGGLPAGGITMLVAPEGIGKNWLANQVIKKQQQFFGANCRIGVISLEMPYDKLFAQACGVRVAMAPSEIRAMEMGEQEMHRDASLRLPEDMRAQLSDQVGEFVVVPPTTAEKALNIACEFVASREFNVVLIDSFGSMLTELEQEKSLEDPNRVGGSALLNTAFARRMNAASAPNRDGMPNLTCTIGINQARENMKKTTPYAPDWVENGGYALKHARWLSIFLKRTGYVNRKVGDKQFRIGKTIQWDIAKQKAGGHEGSTGSYDFLWGECGIDPWMELARLLESLGLITRAGAWYTYEDIRGNGLSDFVAQLRQGGPDRYTDLERLCFLKAGISCNWTGEPWL